MTADRAREIVRHAVVVLAREAGAEPVTRPMFRDRPDEGMTTIEPEPLAGIRAALATEAQAAWKSGRTPAGRS